MTNKHNNHLHRIKAEFDIPGSKSLTHRALIMAALAEGESRLKHPLLCEDTELTMKALESFGARITPDSGDLIVEGTGGILAKEGREIDLKNSGTSMRLLTTVAALSPGTWTLTGSERMKERPLAPLLTALADLGVSAKALNGSGYPPVRVEGGGIKGGLARISAAKSSQFLSSLLISSPYAENDVTIEVIDSVSSWPYVELTMMMMKAFGVEINRQGRERFEVKAGQRYRAGQLTIEGDCSSAAYFWAAAAATESYIVTRNVKPFSLQPDSRFLDVLARMGCDVTLGGDWVAVEGGPLLGLEVDMNSMPDQVPTLAVLAALAEGRTRIYNVAHLRYKESDRLGDVATELAKIGAEVTVKEDGLEIVGQGLTGAVIDPHGDHRLAMSFAVARLIEPGIEILDPDCVVKSFPNFWELFNKISS